MPLILGHSDLVIPSPMSHFAFEFPLALAIGMPVATAALIWLALGLRRQGCQRWQAAAILLLRLAAAGVLLLLIARPVWVESQEEVAQRNRVVLLIDRSESMSLQDDESPRYQRAVAFARDKLLPALAAAELQTQAYLFAEDAEASDGPAIAAAQAAGRGTNLGRAIVHAVTASAEPPLAVIALTDGALNESADNSRAVSLLVDNGIALIGVGFGSESGARVLSIERVVAPSIVSPKQQFHVAAHLRATGDGPLPDFELALLRDGQIAETRKIHGLTGPRLWQESFPVTEETPSLHTYTVQLFPPQDAGIQCPAADGAATVRITDEQQLRVLFVQGGLTWDYKFIRLALRDDPAIKLSGLSRTANNGAFVQSVENETDLVGGFPATIEALVPFRVVILSNLRPTELTTAQQDLLAQFCGENGGGLLMMGGASTFNASWQGSRLEELLPVEFATLPGRSGNFRLQLTDEALAHPVFQISSAGDVRNAWSRLPNFSEFAAVDSLKPGAQVWMRHPAAAAANQAEKDSPLMAVQRYGAGLSAVICVQNFWRWRLAKESDVEHFDRFWRQLLRHLGEGGRDKILLTFPDQQLQPNTDIRVVIEKRPDPAGGSTAAEPHTVRVTDEQDKTVTEQQVTLRPGATAEIAFRGEQPGVYKLAVLDSRGVIAASRSVELRDVAKEFLATARNMESLKQWSLLSGGVAVKAEDSPDAAELIDRLKTDREQPRSLPRHEPAGINPWVLALLLASLGGEWLLRKRWGLR